MMEMCNIKYAQVEQRIISCSAIAMCCITAHAPRYYYML